MTTRNDDVEPAELPFGDRLADARSRKGVDIHRATAAESLIQPSDTQSTWCMWERRKPRILDIGWN